MTVLDKIGITVYNAVSGRKPLTAREIAGKTHLPLDIVEKYLKRFESLALVEKCASYRRNPAYSPSNIYVEL